MKNTIPEYAMKESESAGRPDSGTKQAAGKSNMPDAALGKHPAASTVTEAKDVAGAARKCLDNQVGENGNPKKRDASGWGTGHGAAENEKELD